MQQRIIGYRKTGVPIWQIAGGSETPPETPPAGNPPAGDGYPKDTPVADMQPAEQAAYWRAQSRKHEDRVKAYGDLTPDQVKQLKAAQEKAAQDALTEQERAVAAARAEGRAEASQETAQESVVAMLTMGLMGGGREENAAAAMVDLLDPRKFITDGKPDVTKIRAYAESVAPGTGQAGGRFVPDMGAGTRGGTAHATGAAAGLAEAERRGYVTK